MYRKGDTIISTIIFTFSVFITFAPPPAFATDIIIFGGFGKHIYERPLLEQYHPGISGHYGIALSKYWGNIGVEGGYRHQSSIELSGIDEIVFDQIYAEIRVKWKLGH